MINHISIRDFAIIKNTDVDFYSGLNIITGETGSGKSIVVTAISLALGSRADSSFVRFGTDKAIIELSGEIDGEEVIISREINSNGKNLCKLNGRLVTLSELQLTCQKLADIHGQYDNQSLLNTENHLTLVDTYGFEQINKLKSSYSNEYQSYIEKKAKLNKLLSLSSENARILDFYKFEISEIKSAKLVPGEDTELEERLDMLKNSEKITSDASHAYDLIDGERGAYSTLGSALSYIESLAEYSGKLSELLESCNDAYYRLEEAVSVLRDTVDEMTFDPSELDDAIERLELIKSLKKKYGSTIEDILAYCDSIEGELLTIENFDDEKLNLEASLSKSYEALISAGNKLSEARKAVAKDLSKKILIELNDLNFSGAALEIRFEPKSSPDENGLDDVEILISTNKGEPLKPLVKTASGGEISRIMLAIKKITASSDAIPTLIFDEIDQGISGQAAHVVGKKLREISREKQILCITHLPQIAAMADTAYRIFKHSDDSSTYTHIEKLDSGAQIDEIARLIGGETITDATRKNAEELIESAKNI
ncbi:MAG: DNA repair protein RecN [[Eubacterium] sulci]|nr:DNA repair protein RecN [[Eubacterium] sulci]